MKTLAASSVSPAVNVAAPAVIADFLWTFRQNRGAVIGFAIVLFFLFVAIFAPWLAPYDPAQVHEGQFRVPPFWQESGSTKFIFGTDDVGRDLLSRLIYGTRISLGVGFLVVLISLTVGSLLGLWAGVRGGWVDAAILRFTDVLMAIPSILLAIVVVAVLGPGLLNAVIAVSIIACPSFIRLVRAQAMTERAKVYVVAAKNFGAGGTRIALWHILPNCMAPIIVQGTLGFSEGILGTAALGFLGLGAQPPTAEWGTMLSDARAFIESSPWMVTLPGLCILLVVLGFNLLGDGLRDALDPRLKR